MGPPRVDPVELQRRKAAERERLARERGRRTAREELARGLAAPVRSTRRDEEEIRRGKRKTPEEPPQGEKRPRAEEQPRDAQAPSRTAASDSLHKFVLPADRASARSTDRPLDAYTKWFQLPSSSSVLKVSRSATTMVHNLFGPTDRAVIEQQAKHSDPVLEDQLCFNLMQTTATSKILLDRLSDLRKAFHAARESADNWEKEWKVADEENRELKAAVRTMERATAEAKASFDARVEEVARRKAEELAAKKIAEQLPKAVDGEINRRTREIATSWLEGSAEGTTYLEDAVLPYFEEGQKDIRRRLLERDSSFDVSWIDALFAASVVPSDPPVSGSAPPPSATTDDALPPSLAEGS